MSRLLVIFALLWSLIGVAWAGVNVNTADLEQLKTLPGIGDAKAAAIIAYRSEHGPFATVDDLASVSGIGPATVEKLRPMVELGDGTVSRSAPAPKAEASAPAGPVVNINKASAEELDALPGIGATKAAAIVADRAAKGPFASCDELTRITGIGVATVEKLKASCTAQ